MSEGELIKLDQVYELVNPMEQEEGEKLADIVSSCSSHLIGLIEEKDKEVFAGATCIFSFTSCPFFMVVW